MTDLTISEVQQLLDEDEDVAKHREHDDCCDHIGREVHARPAISPERLAAVSIRLTILALLAAAAGGCLGYAALYVKSGF